DGASNRPGRSYTWRSTWRRKSRSTYAPAHRFRVVFVIISGDTPRPGNGDPGDAGPHWHAIPSVAVGTGLFTGLSASRRLLSSLVSLENAPFGVNCVL